MSSYFYGFKKRNGPRRDCRIIWDRIANSASDLNEYYLDPHCQLIHLFLCIPKYADNPKEIGKKVELIIKNLMRMGIVSLNERGYKVERQRFHLPSNSPIINPYRTLLRLKSLDRMQKLESDEGYSFSVLLSATQKERRWIQNEFLNFLKRMERVVEKAPSQEVFQINFDLLGWE